MTDQSFQQPSKNTDMPAWRSNQDEPTNNRNSISSVDYIASTSLIENWLSKHCDPSAHLQTFDLVSNTADLSDKKDMLYLESGVCHNVFHYRSLFSS